MKRWVLLLTCLRVRAIHVEVVENLSANVVLNALSRFFSRQIALRTLWSDQGTNLVGAATELKTAWKSCAESSADFLQRCGLTWKFAPAKAPQWGGAYERMVALFKRALGGVVDSVELTIHVFHTCIVAAEHIVNTRPLVPVPVDSRDADALSPFSFLCPGAFATSAADILPPATDVQRQRLSTT